MTVRRPYDLWNDPGNIDSQTARVSNAWIEQIDRDCELKKALMVVELVTGDLCRFRAATSLLETSDVTGNDRFVAPALMAEEEIDLNYDIGSGSTSARSASFTIPAWFVDVPERIVSGHSLAGFAEVSLLVNGMSWNDRQVIIRGDVSGGVTFGPNRKRVQPTPNDPELCDAGQFSFSVQDPRESSDAMFPAFVVDEESQANPPDTSIGMPYPVVFGGGTVDAILIESSVSDPVYVAVFDHGWDVTLVFKDGIIVPISEFIVVEDHDGNGVPVTLIDFTGGVLVFTDADEILVRLERPSPQEDTQPHLIDVARQAISRHTLVGDLMINNQLFADAEAKLGEFGVQAVVNSQSTVLQWVEQGLSDDFPMVSWVWRSGRYGPVVTDFRAVSRTQLCVGTNRLRFLTSEPTESPKNEVFNSFTIRYDYDRLTDTFQGIVRANATTDNILAVSVDAVGLRPFPVVESIMIRDDVIAGLTLEWMVAHLSLPTFYVEYAGAACLWFELSLGDTIDLTHPEFGWYEVKATVERMTYMRGRVNLGLRVWQNTLRTGPFPPPPGA